MPVFFSQFLKSDVFSFHWYPIFVKWYLTKSICVETDLSFIEQEGLILFDEIVCFDTLDIVNDISNTQLWYGVFVITPTDVACNPNLSLDFDLTWTNLYRNYIF